MQYVQYLLVIHLSLPQNSLSHFSILSPLRTISWGDSDYQDFDFPVDTASDSDDSYERPLRQLPLRGPIRASLRRSRNVFAVEKRYPVSPSKDTMFDVGRRNHRSVDSHRFPR